MPVSNYTFMFPNMGFAPQQGSAAAELSLLQSLRSMCGHQHVLPWVLRTLQTLMEEGKCLDVLRTVDPTACSRVVIESSIRTSGSDKRDGIMRLSAAKFLDIYLIDIVTESPQVLVGREIHLLTASSALSLYSH